MQRASSGPSVAIGPFISFYQEVSAGLVTAAPASNQKGQETARSAPAAASSRTRGGLSHNLAEPEGEECQIVQWGKAGNQASICK